MGSLLRVTTKPLMRGDGGGYGACCSGRWPAVGVWAAVRAEEMRNALALILFYKWSQQDFLMIGGI